MAKRRKNRFKIFIRLSFAFLAFFVFCYFFQISQLSQISYEMSRNQEQADKIKKEIAGLEASLIQNNTLYEYEKKLNEMGYQKIDRIDYVVLSGAVVAKNK